MEASDQSKKNQGLAPSGNEGVAHTPGPWRVKWNDGEAKSTEILAGTNPNAIAHVFATDIDKTARADARLIAAAPDLYAALLDAKSAIDQLAEEGRYFDTMDKRMGLQGAIARALALTEGR